MRTTTTFAASVVEVVEPAIPAPAGLEEQLAVELELDRQVDKALAAIITPSMTVSRRRRSMMSAMLRSSARRWRSVIPWRVPVNPTCIALAIIAAAFPASRRAARLPSFRGYGGPP
jgi:hypothetical protein